MMKNTTKVKDKKRKPVKLAVLFVILALVLTGLAFAGHEIYVYYDEATALAHQAEELKSEIKALVVHVEKGNYEAANLSVQKIDNLSAEIRSTINSQRWQLIQEKSPKYGEDLKTATAYLDVVDEASNTLIKPAVKFLREKGLPSKAAFTKISPELGKTLNDYSNLIDELCPAAEKVLNDFNSLPTFQIDKLESKVSKYRVLAKENAPEILTYLAFAKKTSDTFLRPVSKYLIDNGSALKIDIDMEKIGPELGSQLLIIADGVDELCPLAENTLKEVNTLPAFKIEKLEKKLSKYRSFAKNNEAEIISLLKFAKEISTGMIRPAVAVMNRSQLSNLKTKDGDIDTKIIRDYLSLVEIARPFVSRSKDLLKTNKLLKDHQKAIAKITSKLESVESLFVEYDTYVPYIDVLLGDGSDKTYLLVAQNSAEIRSAGGLPGSVGVITIKDGILHIGEFQPIMSAIPWKNKGVNKFSSTEAKLFQKNWYCDKLTAATVNPHFPRVAQLLSNGYKKKHKKTVDGIISMTPAIVGRMIAITGPFTLSNGVKLDEKYAVKYLQRDIYFQYYTKKTIDNYTLRKKADDKANALFAESAKKVISLTMSKLDIKTIRKIIDIVKKSSEDRVFMMWMSDPANEEIVKKLGCSGSLNYDPANPEIGIFYNVKAGNKLGIYVDINATLGKGKTNKDGSITYPVTVKLSNKIDKTSEKKGKGNPYLTSRQDGNMRSLVFFFAPSGGKITDFKNNSRIKSQSATYENLKVYSPQVFMLKPRTTITFTFKVTTAPGVTAKPRIVTTPLLSEYRKVKAPK